jgi:hypothetical protein
MKQFAQKEIVCNYMVPSEKVFTYKQNQVVAIKLLLLNYYSLIRNINNFKIPFLSPNLYKNQMKPSFTQYSCKVT